MEEGFGVLDAEQGLVGGKVNRDMWMPMARRPEQLVRRPHVSKTHFGALWDLAFDVSGLYTLGNLLGCLAFQPQFCPKFVIRQYSSRGLWVETNGSSGFRVIVNVIPDLHRSERRSSAKPVHDHAHKAVVPLVHGLKSGRREYLYRGVVGNVVWSRALGQRDFNVSRQAAPLIIPMRRALITANPQRILSGSDWPHPDTGSGRKPSDVSRLLRVDDGHLLNLLATWVPDETLRKTMLVDNPATLYAF
jgi:hypothetical protein